MDKKGITIVELLAAIVLFGIVLALVSTILTTIIRANKEIQITTQANVEGNYLTTVIESKLSDFEFDTDIPPNCTGSSCILSSSYRYVLSDNEVTLNHDYIQLTIAEESNGVRIILENLTTSTVLSNQYFLVDYFDLNMTSSTSSISNQFRVQINIELVDEFNKSYVFIATHVYELPE